MDSLTHDKQRGVYITSNLSTIYYVEIGEEEQHKIEYGFSSVWGTLQEIIGNFRTITYHEIGVEKGSKGLLSRYLKLLIANGLAETVGGDKTKIFRLTNQGEIVRNTIS